MLQRVLNEMWVDPEILAQLNDTQKQTLFCKMREEQIRRWRHYEDTNEKPSKISDRRKPRKSVNFLLDDKGEPWTWVMGEHENDKKIDDILVEEARELARKQAEMETEQLLRTVEKELELAPIQHEDIATPKFPDIQTDAEPKIVVDNYLKENKFAFNDRSLTTPKSTLINFTFDCYRSKTDDDYTCRFTPSISDKRISVKRPTLVSEKIAVWEKRVMEKKATEIFERMQQKKMQSVNEAKHCEQVQEELWKEQERKAKEAELKMREIARKAREEHRKNPQDDAILIS